MRFPKQFVTDGTLASMRDLPGGAWRVLLVLIAEAGEDAIASITQTDIAAMAGISRVSVQESIKRLEKKGAVRASEGRGKRHEYTVLPAYKLTSTPGIRFATYPQEDANPRVGNSVDKMQTPGLATPKSALARVPNSPTGTTHPHDPNARSALASLITDRRLPLTLDELITNAYRLGTGDPWEGYLVIKATTTDALGPDVKNPAAVLRYRLKKATPRRNIPKNDEWMYRGDPTKKRTGIQKNDEWMYTA